MQLQILRIGKCHGRRMDFFQEGNSCEISFSKLREIIVLLKL